MVILQFNKLIRNKWVWGVFAIAISAFFAFDFLLDDIRRSDEGDDKTSAAGVLAGEPVNLNLFQSLARDNRGYGENRQLDLDEATVNLRAISDYAELKVAEANGIAIPDDYIQQIIRNQQAFQVNGVFSFDRYQALLRQQLGLTPEMWEESLKRQQAQMCFRQALVGSAVWASPAEVDRAVADVTDVLTVKVANFAQDPKEAEAVTVDEAGLRKWYDEHLKELELPERAKVRTIRFDATDKDILAKMVVTSNDVETVYNATIDRYTSTNTNGEEVTKSLEEVYADVERQARQIAAVECFETNLNELVWVATNETGLSRFEAIARAGGHSVVTSGWFAVNGAYVEGLTQRASSICPGARTFEESVAQLEEGGDYCCSIVTSESAVWLVERIATSAAHTASFDEAKEAIRPRALEDARADAFKAKVDAIAKQGAAAVRQLKDISTNLVFSVKDLEPGQFPDEMAVAQAAMKLAKGEVSEFQRTGRGRGVLVVCEDRTAGDAAQAMLVRDNIARSIAMGQMRMLPEAWRTWNVARMGFQPGPASRIDKDDASK